MVNAISHATEVRQSSTGHTSIPRRWRFRGKTFKSSIMAPEVLKRTRRDLSPVTAISHCTDLRQSSSSRILVPRRRHGRILSCRFSAMVLQEKSSDALSGYAKSLILLVVAQQDGRTIESMVQGEKRWHTQYPPGGNERCSQSQRKLSHITGSSTAGLQCH